MPWEPTCRTASKGWQKKQKVNSAAPTFVRIINQNVLTTLSDGQRTALAKLLPEGQQTDHELLRNIQSPQFRQAMEALEDAVNSYECADIFRSFGIYDEEIFRSAKTRLLTSH
jgi:hypothetical protein